MEAGAECAARKRKAGSGSVNGLEVSVVRAVAAVDREDERARADECSGFEGKTMMRGEREGSGQRAAYATAPDARQDVRQRVGVMSQMWEATRGVAGGEWSVMERLEVMDQPFLAWGRGVERKPTCTRVEGRRVDSTTIHRDACKVGHGIHGLLGRGWTLTRSERARASCRRRGDRLGAVSRVVASDDSAAT